MHLWLSNRSSQWPGPGPGPTLFSRVDFQVHKSPDEKVLMEESGEKEKIAGDRKMERSQISEDSPLCNLKRKRYIFKFWELQNGIIQNIYLQIRIQVVLRLG